MLKFFRQYNKVILAVGASVLMVAFLIQPVLSMFQPDPTKQVEGRMMDDQVVRVSDIRAADAELRLLRNIPGISQLVATSVGAQDSPLHWHLLVNEARDAGLSASEAEVKSVLATVGLTEEELPRMSQNLGASEQFIRHAVRHWLMVEQWRDLLTGRAFGAESGGGVIGSSSPGLWRLSMMSSAEQAARSGNMQLANTIIGVMGGSARLSDPAVRTFLQERLATVGGSFVKVPAEHYLDQVPEPTEDQIQQHFATYRGYLPGASEPFGFGYRVPDRVKLEYLTIPYDQALEQARVMESDAIEYFNNNREMIDRAWEQVYRGDSDKPTPDYRDVSDLIKRQLRAEKADELINRAVKEAQSMIGDAERALPDDGRYKQVPEDYQPLALEDVAAALRERFELDVRVERHTDQWVVSDDLSSLPGIGRAALPTGGQAQYGFAEYVQAARAFEPATDNPLTGLRLQAGIVSKPLRGRDGNAYLFRLTDAQPAHDLEKVDEVRELVTHHVRMLQAYEMLKSEQDVWLTEAMNNGLSAVADELDTSTAPFGPTPQLLHTGGGSTITPNVPGIGPDEGFLDAVFAKARKLPMDVPLEDQPASRRIVAEPIDNRLALALARVDEYNPLTRSDFRFYANQPGLRVALTNELAGAAAANPLSLEAVKERVGYVSESDREAGEDQDMTASDTAEAPASSDAENEPAAQ